MRGATESDHGKGSYGGSGRGYRQASSDGDLTRAEEVDSGPGGERPVGVEEVGRGVDLRVRVVGGAPVAAEATPAVVDGGVGQEEACGVVVAWDGDRGHLGECLGCGVPHLGDELWGLVGEADGVVLAAGDEDFSVGENEAIVECAREGHGVDGGDLRHGIGIRDGDYVGVGGRVRI